MSKRTLKPGDRIVIDESGEPEMGTLIFINDCWAIYENESADQCCLSYPQNAIRKATKKDEREATLRDIQNCGGD